MMIDNFLIIYIIFSRIFELILSKINTVNLINNGASEHHSSHYILMVFFHIIFIVYFLALSLKTLQIDFKFLIFFVFLQFIRYKIIYDLGKYWTTRIIVLEKEPLIKNGLYKYIKHPNYLVVLAEIMTVCLIFSDYLALLIFTFIKSILLFIRIKYEDKANLKRRLK